MKRMNWLVIGLAIAGLSVGCGDDDTTGTPDTGGGDTGGDTSGEDTGGGGINENCPEDDDGVAYMGRNMGACCSSASNAAKQDAPEFRISGLDITSPSSLANVVIAGQLQTAIDDGSFNWLIQVSGASADGTVDVTTGFGTLNAADNSYDFATGEFAPVMTTATLTGETFVAETLDMTVIVPIVDEEGNPTLSLPLQQLTLETATMSEMRDCVGVRNRNSFDTTQSSLRTYITIEDAMSQQVSISALDTSLCNILRGAVTAGPDENCLDTARADWRSKPDALCDAGTCTEGACDPDDDCNAWTLAGGVSAQAVEIN